MPESTAKLLGPVCLGFLGAFGPFKSQKKLPEAKSHELLGFWLVGAVLLLESPKANCLKMAKSSNKQGLKLLLSSELLSQDEKRNVTTEEIGNTIP